MKTNRLTIGILAHVDAGKTTLSESILYNTGSIDKIGRVDHKDAYLDTFDLEKERGITIFSKQAMFPLGDYQVSLLDTPGHVDFSAEMERVLRVLDYAILVINGTDGVQGHTMTVWKLLRRYHVPTFIFVNKMDLVSAHKASLIDVIKQKLDANCIEFTGEEAERMDALAMCDELLMDHYLEEGYIPDTAIRQAITRRHVYPLYFGSALKNEGVEAFLEGFGNYAKSPSYPDVFGARVFKVARVGRERLTYLKVTGGSLRVKDVLTNRHQRNIELTEEDTQEVWEDKVDQIRLYSGTAYEAVKEVAAGTVCAVTGLGMTKAGDGLGFENKGEDPSLVPVLNYRVVFPEGTNIYGMLKDLRILEEEEPHLNVVWNERLSEIHMQVMGEIQIEILRRTISERFGVDVSFEKGSLVYRETIDAPVVGMGHFEPLKHYAEVHLLIEPLPIGSGIQVATSCSEDILDRNWQRLVASHLKERKHLGVLTGSELTDMRITLVTGRAHKKHTEGGDFREATFRALRQGLMKSKSVLLEPVYRFNLELPKEMLGRAMSDIDRMQGQCEDPKIVGEEAIIQGTAPVSTMMNYGAEVIAYSKGQGRLDLTLNGYKPCHNQQEIIDRVAYDPQQDVDNPAGSVFCSKGVGYGVPWQEADSHMHMDSGIRLDKKEAPTATETSMRTTRKSYSDEELEAVFVKTYGERKSYTPTTGKRLFDQPSVGKIDGKPYKESQASKKKAEDQYLLVDGYNIVFAWEELKALAVENLDAARSRLMNILSNYQGYTGETVILVFDAYRVAGNRGEMFSYHNIHVVYTKEAETADQYIERLVNDIRPKHEVTVATSDVVEQVIILGKGARRLSAENFKLEVEAANKANEDHYSQTTGDDKHRPIGEALNKKR